MWIMECHISVATITLFLHFMFIWKVTDGSENKKNDTKRPNILFIMADDLGWNDVSWHNPKMPTAVLHNLATNYAAILNQSYVNQVCSPTRSAFLTGFYPFHIGTQDGVFEGMEPGGVPLRFAFISEYFQRLGYKTYMVGKWHLGYCNYSYIPSGRGFDYFYGYYLSIADYFTHHYFLNLPGRRIDALDLWDQLKPDFSKLGVYSTEMYADKAIEIIRNQTAIEPFFMYLAFQAPHYPLEVPMKYLAPCSHYRNRKRRTYCAMVVAMDLAIGRVVRALTDAGLYNNTIIVFNSDNGGEVRFGGNNFPLRGCKHTLWEGGNRAVSFVHSPKFIQNPGVRNDRLFSIVDWFPTLLTAVGMETSRHGDGVNQWDMITKGSFSQRRGLVYNIYRAGAAIRQGKYKLIIGVPGPRGLNYWYPPPNEFTGTSVNQNRKRRKRYYQLKGTWLFDLKNDPTEHVNLAGRRVHLVKRMKAEIFRLRAQAAPSAYKPFDPRGDPKLHNGTMATGWC